MKEVIPYTVERAFGVTIRSCRSRKRGIQRRCYRAGHDT